MPNYKLYKDVYREKNSFDGQVQHDVAYRPNRFNTVHLPCCNQVHYIRIANKMHFNVHDVFELHFCHQHVSAAIAAILLVKLLQKYKGTMWLVVSSLHNN
jgi:hypothetical protein